MFHNHYYFLALSEAPTVCNHRQATRSLLLLQPAVSVDCRQDAGWVPLCLGSIPTLTIKNLDIQELLPTRGKTQTKSHEETATGKDMPRKWFMRKKQPVPKPRACPRQTRSISVCAGQGLPHRHAGCERCATPGTKASAPLCPLDAAGVVQMFSVAASCQAKHLLPAAGTPWVWACRSLPSQGACGF